MEQEVYDAHVSNLKRGEMVVISGRSALSKEQLHFAIRAAKDTVPGDPEAEDTTLIPVVEDHLESEELEDLRNLAASLGLSVHDGGETKDELIESIRTVRLELQHKP